MKSVIVELGSRRLYSGNEFFKVCMSHYYGEKLFLAFWNQKYQIPAFYLFWKYVKIPWP